MNFWKLKKWFFWLTEEINRHRCENDYRCMQNFPETTIIDSFRYSALSPKCKVHYFRTLQQ